MMSDFCVFILSHGRPNNVTTYTSLRNAGYTGQIFLIVDNEDATVNEYKRIFGKDNVVVFDKAKAAQTVDSAYNSDNRKAIVYARNATFDIAREKGFRYFLETDDDYTGWYYLFDEDKKFRSLTISNLDSVFEAVLKFYKSIPAVTIAFAQGGDFIGGAENSHAKIMLLRKAMNTFFCCVDRPVNWRGLLNEDVSTYVLSGSRGVLFLTLTQVSINQKQTQSLGGGMSETYGNSGTYVKSFYSVLHSPSCVSIRIIGTSYQRIHHNIIWKNAVPLILSEEHRKILTHEKSA